MTNLIHESIKALEIKTSIEIEIETQPVTAAAKINKFSIEFKVFCTSYLSVILIYLFSKTISCFYYFFGCKFLAYASFSQINL